MFVHCAAPGPFNGNAAWEVFESDRQLNLSTLFVPPVSISTSCLAALESARLNGTLDLEFGHQLLGQGASENDILKSLVQHFNPTMLVEGRPFDGLITISNVFHFLVLLDKDPRVGCRFLRGNRLSMYSIPGRRMNVCDHMKRMAHDHKALQMTASELERHELMMAKLEVLRRDDRGCFNVAARVQCEARTPNSSVALPPASSHPRLVLFSQSFAKRFIFLSPQEKAKRLLRKEKKAAADSA